MQRFAALLVPVFVTGCALPPAYTIASFAADGISYLATGKSTTDHALSIVAQEDCAMLRALREKAICVPDHDFPVLVAKGSVPEGMTPAPVQVASLAKADDLRDPPVMAKVPAPTPVKVASLSKADHAVSQPSEAKEPGLAMVQKSIAALSGPVRTVSLPKQNETTSGSPAVLIAALELVQKPVAKAPMPVVPRQLAAKVIPAKPAPVETSQLAERVWPKAPSRPTIAASRGRTVLSLCAGLQGMRPAGQCGLGPDA